MVGGSAARSASGPYHLGPSSFVLKAFVLRLLSSVLKRDEDRGQRTEDKEFRTLARKCLDSSSQVNSDTMCSARYSKVRKDDN